MRKIICKCNRKECTLDNYEDMCFKQTKKIFCDSCSKEMDCDTITITFGYPHSFDTDEKDFCCDKCVLEWYKQTLGGAIL